MIFFKPKTVTLFPQNSTLKQQKMRGTAFSINKLRNIYEN